MQLKNRLSPKAELKSQGGGFSRVFEYAGGLCGTHARAGARADVTHRARGGAPVPRDLAPGHAPPTPITKARPSDANSQSNDNTSYACGMLTTPRVDMTC